MVGVDLAKEVLNNKIRLNYANSSMSLLESYQKW